METLTVICPSCQRPLRVPESLLGQTVKCPSCQHTFAAPDSLEEAPPRRPPLRPEPEPPPPPPRPRIDDRFEDDRPRPWPAADYDDDYAESYRRPPGERQGKVQAIAIMQIVNIVNGDIANCVMGILTLVFLGEKPVKNFFRGR